MASSIPPLRISHPSRRNAPDPRFFTGPEGQGVPTAKERSLTAWRRSANVFSETIRSQPPGRWHQQTAAASPAAHTPMRPHALHCQPSRQCGWAPAGPGLVGWQVTSRATGSPLHVRIGPGLAATSDLAIGKTITHLCNFSSKRACNWFPGKCTIPAKSGRQFS